MTTSQSLATDTVDATDAALALAVEEATVVLPETEDAAVAPVVNAVCKTIRFTIS